MRLYYSSGSPFARKIRVLLLEKSAAHETELVDLWGRNDLKSTNPLGKVPALKLDDGRVLVNSPLIADYVDGCFPEPRFIPVDPEERLEVRRWEALADGTMEAAVASFYEARFHDEQRRSQAWLDHQRGKLDSGFAALEAMLGGREWCVGRAMSLADIALGCHIGFINARHPAFFRQDRYPALAGLWKRMEARESFKRTAPPPS